MRETVRINEGDERYQDMIDHVKEAIKTNEGALIVAKSKENKKPNITPVLEMDGMLFYAAHETKYGMCYSTKTNDEMIKAAIQNTIDGIRVDYVDSTIEDWFEDGFKPMMKLEDWNPGRNCNRMILLTRENKMFGAGVLFCNDVLHQIWEKIGNYYVIPSSIHEILIVRDNGEYEKEGFDQMIREVNATMVNEDDKLSDRAFYYDGKLK